MDENPDYDNLDILSRDAEEKYFDGDEEEEEEEEDDVMWCKSFWTVETLQCLGEGENFFFKPIVDFKHLFF